MLGGHVGLWQGGPANLVAAPLQYAAMAVYLVQRIWQSALVLQPHTPLKQLVP